MAAYTLEPVGLAPFSAAVRNPDRQRAIVVLGMHRSGTSVLTRGLRALGVDLGNRLNRPGADNPRGFFEDADIQNLNEGALRALGHEWHSMAPILAEEAAKPAMEDFAVRATALLRDKLRDGACLGLKDPRLCRLLPLWKKAFARLDLQVSYVIAVRNPLSVAQSLATRDGFAREKSYFLWLEHMYSAVVQVAGADCIAVDYDRLLDDPANQLARLARRLQLDFDPAGAELERFRDSFLSGALRHSRHSLAELQADAAAPVIAASFFRLLRGLTDGTQEFEQLRLAPVLRGVGDLLANAYHALRYLDDTAPLPVAAYQRLRGLRSTDDALAVVSGSAPGNVNPAAWRLHTAVQRASNMLRRAHRAAKARRRIRTEVRALCSGGV